MTVQLAQIMPADSWEQVMFQMIANVKRLDEELVEPNASPHSSIKLFG